MIRRILNVFGIGLVVSTQANALELPKPYTEDSVNFMYNLLFCDEPSLFSKNNDGNPTYWEKTLFGNPNEERVRALADNIDEES